ncbi:MAG: 3-deoxy-D-manno-octulosonic acid transferase [Helicobacteraceae bacterium]|nr:3-deoxy-D-manno-octulosonic acid transferase [Helicobacteraceae bacterium]
MKLFTLFYSILLVVLYIIALPVIFTLSFKPKYKNSIPARFFLRNNRAFKENGIWFHVCSFGEAKALQPILQKLEQKRVNISTITATGYSEASKYEADVRYLPFELFLPFWIKEQKQVVVLEAEFWYLLFAIVKSRGSKLILLNARISDRSYPKYKKFSWFYKRVFKFVDKAFVQSIEDQKRFKSLGLENIEVTGNIKLAQKIVATRFFEKLPCEVITAGSTHENEEEPIIKAFIEHKKENNSKLIIVPRHPERFDSVYKLIESNSDNLSHSRWSKTENFEADIVLIDTLGELNNIYAITDVAILGGAFIKSAGGHNPLEPAAFGCKIVTGKHIQNQRELFKYVKDVQFIEESEILKALENAKVLPPSSMNEKIDISRITEYLNKEN